jgi:uncharacterized CHY-type Zn-finger protein
MKEVLCVVCRHPLKRRKYRKDKIGPTCLRKLQSGTAGIQIKAFEDSEIEKWKQKITT